MNTYWIIVKFYNRGWGWSMRWEPLLSDFILLATKLDNLGFSYRKGKVSVTDMEKL